MEIIKNTEPSIRVGILCSPRITFTFNGDYKFGDKVVSGESCASFGNGRIEYEGQFYDNLCFEPLSGATFSIKDVTIGVNFHWQRNETQTFSGALSFVVDGNNLWAVNILPIEDYLYSVIASEMSATSSLELLKAHAIVSRSWLIAQLQRKNPSSHIEQRTDDELIRWYDRDDHKLFDVCADDHCQRYQGLTRISQLVGQKSMKSCLQKLVSRSDAASPVRRAIDETRGMLLISDGEICDARFSKCCGGITETYETCWDDAPHRYLQAFPDHTHASSGYGLTLENEHDAQKWILDNPEAFCNTNDASILRQVLNSYDQETADFYRWKVEYTTAQLSELIKRKTGIDFGEIQSLEAIERGKSGRICRLKIIGSKRTMVIGKELEIRRALSESHLYSSAFVVEKHENGFVLHGAGWGHGVGMCQIGAAVMSERGFGYKAILLHYFRCAMLEKWW